jgi:hypothetical protein
MTLGPNESRTIQIAVQLPPGLAAPGESVDALNCFVVTNPNLVPAGDVGTAPGQPFTPAAGGPGYSCRPFKIRKPPVGSSTTTSAGIPPPPPLPPSLLSCPATMVRIERLDRPGATECACPEGGRWSGQRCEPRIPASIPIPLPPIALQGCPPSMVRIGTQCGCAEHSRWNGHRCEPKVPASVPIPLPPIPLPPIALQGCPPSMVRIGTVRIGTQCGCAEHNRWNGHRCEPKGPAIAMVPPPEIGRARRPPTVTHSCPHGMYWNGHRCQSAKHGRRTRTNPPVITHRRQQPVTIRINTRPVMKRIHTASKRVNIVPKHQSRKVVKRTGHR